MAALVLAVFSMDRSYAQHVDSFHTGRNEVLRIQTALNHLTVIEVSEPVVSVAAGSPAFKVEWRESRVFVQPTEPNIATNLFIWTATERFNYELAPAGPVEKMDFAVDQSPIPAPHPVPVAVKPEPPRPPTEMLLRSTPIRMDRANDKGEGIVVRLRDSYESNGVLYLRYSLRNATSQPYILNAPQPYALTGATMRQSLYNFIGSQLDDKQVSNLKIKEQIPLRTVLSELSATTLSPGQEVFGIVAVAAPATNVPTVLRLQFAPTGSEQVAAFMVR